MPIHNEKTFESELCEYLNANGWLYSQSDTGYDVNQALLPHDLFAWLRETHPGEWLKVAGRHQNDAATETHLLDRLTKLIERDGLLSVLRRGFNDIDARFSLCQFKPGTSLNATAEARYAAVRCRVMRQVHYSQHNRNSIDLVFFVNGLPVATAELKTDFTQTIHHAIRQYQSDRQPKDPTTRKAEPLLTFKRGALVHFAVSTDEVHMTTRLEGKATQFLPFNLGSNGGAGNPPNSHGYRTAYLWERVLQRDAWLDILGRFVQFEKREETAPDGTAVVREKILFPRYHQWEVVNLLVAAARAEGAGQNYLIQHSAGSGKSNSIGWLVHQLASLHDNADNKIFSSVIVVTDRNVLDSQLQETIYQFEHKDGVVAGINTEGSKTAQLVPALINNTPIIVVTIQTFPFVIDALRDVVTLKGRRYAVIADEAHSSQSGQSSQMLKKALGTELEEDDAEEISTEDVLLASMTERTALNDVSFFAFTATPKPKTIERFGRKDADGIPAAFHVYSMQQAIEEGFILDVLQNYMPYKLAFKLAHDGQEYDDRTVDKSKALKSLMRWVRLHSYNIGQKVEIIVEHFRDNIAHRLNGRAKAMVVTGSRKEAVRYKLAMDRYITQQNYTDVSTLVAFSGEVADPESGPQPFSERNMNPGLLSRDLRSGFATDEFNVMIVANKFQTGFDQPQLVAMYVDKRLSGVTAVQTLSRLNRTYPDKDATFVLDFVNDPDEILASFQPYYQTARLSGVSDPNLVHDLRNKLDDARIYTDEEVRRLVEAFVRRDAKQRDLQAALAPAVDRFRVRFRDAVDEQDKAAIEVLQQFRSDLIAFGRTYDFLSQLFDYADVGLESRSIFYRLLIPLIRDVHNGLPVDLSGVVLTHYQLRGQTLRTLALQAATDEDALSPLSAVGSGVPRDPEQARLSEIVQQMNMLFEGELTEADLLNYANHIRDRMLLSDRLREQATTNNREQFALSRDFENELSSAVIDGLESYNEMATQVMRNDQTRRGFAKLLVKIVYDAFRSQPGAPGP